MPLCGLANAGIDFRQIDITVALTSGVALGVAVGLVAGKLLGITVFTYAAVKLKLGSLPLGTGWSQIWGLAAVAGVGFTVSLFIAGLAFDDRILTDYAKVGIFAGSLIAGIIGAAVLLRAKPPSEL